MNPSLACGVHRVRHGGGAACGGCSQYCARLVVRNALYVTGVNPLFHARGHALRTPSPHPAPPHPQPPHPHLTPHPLTSPRTPHLNPRPPLRGPLWLRKDQLFPHLRAHNGPHRRPGHADHPATHQARPAPPPIKPPPTDSTRKEGLMPRIGRPRPTPSRKPCTWRTGSSSCKVAHPTESLDTSQRLSMCPSARTVPSPPRVQQH